LNQIRYSTVFLLFILSFSLAHGQQDSTKRIVIENADKHVIDNTTNPSTKYFRGNVRAFHNGSFFYCDSAIIIANTMNAYGNVTIIQNDTITTFSDDLFYDGDSLYAYLKNKVILQTQKDELFTEYLEYDMRNKKAYYRDRALLKSDKTTLKSKKGTYDLNTSIVTFNEKVTIQGDDFLMNTDTLVYDSKNEIATWNTPALIYQDTAQIFCNSGRYETKIKNANFRGNVQYKKNDAIAKGNFMDYDGLEKLVTLYDTNVQVYFISETDTAYADTIVYNEQTETYILNGKATFYNKENKATGEKITYLKKEDSFKFDGRGSINDSTSTMVADNLDYNKKIKKGIATGTVIWQDTSSKTIIATDTLRLDGEQDYFSAKNLKGKPLLTSYDNADTLYISSNELRKERQYVRIDSAHVDTIVYLKGIGNTEILRTDLQARCDTMLFNQKDSIFTLYGNPILWSDTTQMTADTIKLFMVNGEIDRLILIENALVITSPDLIYYNQIGGNKIDASFLDKSVNKMNVLGNAQCIYYMLDDDDAYIGVNQTDCTSMTFFFKEKKIDQIRFYKEPKSTLYPMDKANHEDIKLKGFKWQSEHRPNVVADLMN
jgi:lipopolysaccharide export system protein LptA